MNQVRKKIRRYVRLVKIICPRLKRSYLKNVKPILKFLFWGGFAILVILLISLLLSMLWVMKSPSAECYFMSLTGVDNKPQLLTFMGWGIGGLVAILGVMGAFLRTAALDEQNKIAKKGHAQQAATSNKQHEMTEKGHIHERFKAATEHLGSQHISVRIAAFNEFYRLAKLEPEQGLKETIFNILCAHLRSTTTDKNYKKEGETSGSPESKTVKPTEEVQSLLNILFKPDKDGGEDKFIFDGLVANLEGVYLQGANLQDAHLQNAKLQGANLQGANLQIANLQKAYLQDAKMQCADLRRVKLQGALLWNTKLQNADIQHAYLQDADLEGPRVGMKADLEGVGLEYARINNQTRIKEDTDIWERWPEPGVNNSWLFRFKS